jgi:hypothetical protein
MSMFPLNSKVFLISLVALSLVGVGCEKKTSAPSGGSTTTTSAAPSDQFAKAGSILLKALTEPQYPLNFSYTAQTQISNRFPMQAGSKPEIGPLSVKAEVTPDEITVDSIRGTKKEHQSARKADAMGWPMIKLALLGPVGNLSMNLAFAAPVAKKAETKPVNGVEADIFTFDTRTASIEQKAGIAMAQSILKGRVKVDAIYGTIAVDKETGRIATFNYDLELSETSGQTWKEHHEGTAFTNQ